MLTPSRQQIMEQIEGGTLIVNSASGDKPSAADDDDVRDLNLVDGMSEGWKLAEVRRLDLRPLLSSSRSSR